MYQRTFLLIHISFLLALPTGAFAQQKTEAEFHAMLEDMYEKSVPLIHAPMLNKRGLGSYVILDTREKEEYDTSHLKGARWAGYDDFQEETVRNLKKDQPIIVYCSVGYRSERMGEKLREMGFSRVYNLYGGIFDWKNQGFPVVDSQGSTEKVHTYNKDWSKWLFNGEKVY